MGERMLHDDDQDPLRANLMKCAMQMAALPSADQQEQPPEVAVEVWRGLLRGEWFVFDHFLGNDRQFVIFRRHERQAVRSARLSPRERQVAADVVLGHSNKVIADHLKVKEATVATHLRRALVKLRVNSRTELIRLLPRQAFTGAPP